jgi:hypothetical protein
MQASVMVLCRLGEADRSRSMLDGVNIRASQSSPLARECRRRRNLSNSENASE